MPAPRRRGRRSQGELHRAFITANGGTRVVFFEPGTGRKKFAIAGRVKQLAR